MENNCNNQDISAENLMESGITPIENSYGTYYCLSIIGQIEGHFALDSNQKTTKYDHVIPLLVALEESEKVDGIIILINTLGGVDVEMTQKEINEINNHQKRYDHVRIDGEPGLLHLRGDEAIAYCRIRKIDSDGARADRQKTVLLQLFKKAKEASSIKVVEVVSELLPYVKTGFSKKEIISIAKYALSHGWLQYQTQTYTIPNDEGLTDAEGKAIKGCVGGTFYGAWIWKVDFPLYSQITQQRIYGKTNITLAENRPKFDKLK